MIISGPPITYSVTKDFPNDVYLPKLNRAKMSGNTDIRIPFNTTRDFFDEDYIHFRPTVTGEIVVLMIRKKKKSISLC